MPQPRKGSRLMLYKMQKIHPNGPIYHILKTTVEDSSNQIRASVSKMGENSR